MLLICKHSTRRFSCIGRILVVISLCASMIIPPQTATPLQAAPATTRLLDPTPGANPGQIRGTVFRDFNANGVMNTTGVAPDVAVDRGVAGVTVTAYNASGTVAGSAVSDSAGNYTIGGLTNGAPYRLEFTTLPSGYQPSARGSGVGTTSGTATQFVTGGTGNVGFGINRPTDYCQKNPMVCAPIFLAGLRTVGGSDPIIGGVDYLDSGMPTLAPVATKASVGSIYGLAYDRTQPKLFSAAFLRRHADLGPAGLGGIYVTIDPEGLTPTTSLLIDLDTVLSLGTIGARDLSDPTNPSYDPDAFDKIGKVGLGDLDLTDDSNTLFVADLNNRQVVRIDLTNYQATGTLPTAAQVSVVPSYRVAGNHAAGSTPPTCTNGLDRLFGLKVYEGKLYVGVVCTGENAGVRNDLTARVLAFDLAANLWSTPISSFSLNFQRGFPWNRNTTLCRTWEPWSNDFFAYTLYLSDATATRVCRPEALLSDIEFDNDGAMILGFMDRSAFKYGFDNFSTDNVPPVDTKLYRYFISGDVMRASFNGSTYTLESGGTTSAGGGCGANGDGRGGGEYYCGERYKSDHVETAAGGLGLLPGSVELTIAAADPINNFSGGLMFLNNQSGASNRTGIQYFRGDANGIPGNFSKAGGMGDVEILCDAAPIEIGNRIWLDTNGDGVQDAGENGIDNLVVQLWADTDNDGAVDTLIGETSTANGGQYYFGGVNNSNLITGQAVNPETVYEVRVATNQSPLTNLLLTPENSAASGSNPTNNPITDGRDSDATLNGLNAVIPFTTGDVGHNNHGLDIGFQPTYSLGNRLWFDTNNDGLDNDGAGGGLGAGVVGATVNLLNSAGTIIATMLTDGNGHYRFDDLLPGVYTVELPASNFAAGGPLHNYQNSTPTFNENVDGNDNGTVNGSLGAGGNVRSAPLTLGAGLQPTGETISGGGVHGPSGDAYDNLSVDFGFYQLILGNRVWFDTNRNGLDDFETGAAGVPVTLRDSGGNVVATTTTDATGYYTFTNLIAGNYTVDIEAPANFLSSTPDDNTNDTNLNDNGQGNGGGTISSQIFELTAGVASGDITVNSATGRTRNPTIDFGLYQPSADLEVLKSVAPPTYTLGIPTAIQYTFVITNYGPDPVASASVTDTQPANVTFNSWNCTIQTAGSGAGIDACGVISGSGDILTTVSLRPGAAAIWTINATVGAGATGNILNTVVEALPPNMTQSLPNRPDTSSAQIVPVQPLFSVGNRVWFDTNDDGGATGPGVAEPVPTVLMQLVDLSTGEVIQTTHTGPDGYYRFDYVPAGTYEIVVAGSNFQPGGPLQGYRNSSFVNTTTTNVTTTVPLADFDNHDHGINAAGHLMDGVHSVPFRLGVGLQPVGEVAVGGGADGPHGDAQSNLTIDFGFNRQETGNQLWYDLNDNGVFDAGEPPLPAGVVVELYTVVNGVVSAAPVLTTTTDANGQYLFAAGNQVNLDPNNRVIDLFVSIPAGQPALNSYAPSTARNEGGGVDGANTGAMGATGVITSGLFYPFPGETTNGALVDDALGFTYQPTIDFGFVLQTYSVGNRVWFDTDNDGIFDAGEQPIPGVVIELRAVNGDVITTTVTGPDGAYRFDNLLAGTYEVVVAPSNFVLGAPLQGYQNSTPTTAPSSDPATDNLDHGLNTGIEAIDGIHSDPITLGPGLQPTGEVAIGGGTNGPSGDANDNLTIDFGFYHLTLGNVVWHDLNNNGQLDLGEPGIDGATVRLFAADGVTEILVGPDAMLGTIDDGPGGIVTGVDGQYLFSGLTPGDYIVKVTPPVNYFSSTGAQATSGPYEPGLDPDNNLENDDNGTDGSGADVGLTISLPVTLMPGDAGAANQNTIEPNTGTTANPTVDFGFYQPAGLGDFVWLDVNANGVQDPGEPGIEGVTVTLYNETGQVVGTTQTNELGNYAFTGLPPGDYSVVFTPPAGYLVSPPNVDDDATDSDANANGRAPLPDPLVSGEQDPTLDLGLYQPASLGDYVWLDRDADGYQDEGELPLPGVTVTLFNADGTPVIDINGDPVAPQQTDANGNYLFTNLVPGDYYIQFTPPAGYHRSPANVIGETIGDEFDSDADPLTGRTEVTTLSSGENDSTWDAGFYVPPAIGNYVWEDANINGVQDPGEPPIPGVTVRLLDEDGNVVDTTVTDANGFYGFTDLVPGVYSLEFASPAGYLPSPPNVGGDDAVDSDPDLITGRTITTTLESGEYDPTWDAGYYRLASLGNYVWNDLDRDGAQDDGEPTVANVLIELYRPDGTLVMTTTTDSTGLYQFTNLLPGDYYIVAKPGTGVVFTQQDQSSDDATDSDVDNTGRTTTISLVSGENDMTWDIGIVTTPNNLDEEAEPTQSQSRRLFLPIITKL